MDKTKIDWCDSSWNPVTGCRNDCLYCYARSMVHRFGKYIPNGLYTFDELEKRMAVIDLKKREKDGNPYPYLFTPTLHRYRLNDYLNKKHRTIFVCSMADLFGYWVPDEWIAEVFAACKAAPQHTYLFLTKSPSRYYNLEDSDNWWFGTTCTKQEDFYTGGRAQDLYCSLMRNTFLSIEPIQEELHGIALRSLSCFKWIIIGAETGNRKDRVKPEKKWIDAIVDTCKLHGIPVFMKSSLKELMGPDFIQEYPREDRT